VSDRLDGRFDFLRAVALVAVAALVAACGPVPPEPPFGPGTPCTRDAAVASDTVVIAAGVCNPWCIHVPAGTPVYFINNDPFLYLFAAEPALPYEVQVPQHAGAVTLPLAAGTVTWTAVHQPAATVTVFAE
jgi:hypothetical protein